MSISYAALNRTQRAARARLMIDGGTLKLLLSTLCSDLDRLAAFRIHWSISTTALSLSRLLQRRCLCVPMSTRRAEPYNRDSR